ncbi:MAG: hypothetical protein HOO04_07480 [Phycisphaerae bacterium]|nr:hypothetical protein [Phycisphaerae bacterium]
MIRPLCMSHQLHQKDTYITPIRSTVNSQCGFIQRGEAIKIVELIDLSCTLTGFFRNHASQGGAIQLEALPTGGVTALLHVCATLGNRDFDRSDHVWPIRPRHFECGNGFSEGINSM